MPKQAIRILCASLLALAACHKDQGSGMVGPDAKGPIVIGHVASMTGPQATFGTSSDRGFRIFFDELNAKGGVKGRQIKLVTLDDQGKPEEAATAATRLIASDHVTALVGEVSSTLSIFMAPKAQLAKVPMISPSSTNEKVTAIGDYIFRACFIDPFQGYVMAKFARETLHMSKVAILKDVRNDYSMGLAKVFKEQFTKMGGTIVSEQSFSQNDVDFKAQLTNIKSAAPEAIFEPGYYTDTGLIARQARELGITRAAPRRRRLGLRQALRDRRRGARGAATSRTTIRSMIRRRRSRPSSPTTSSAPGLTPDSLSAQAYDAAGMLADAMQRAPDLSGAAIRDALAATANFQGVTGTITLDKNRNPIKPAVVLKIGKGGTYEFVTRIQPEGT